MEPLNLIALVTAAGFIFKSSAKSEDGSYKKPANNNAIKKNTQTYTKVTEHKKSHLNVDEIEVLDEYKCIQERGQLYLMIKFPL